MHGSMKVREKTRHSFFLKQQFYLYTIKINRKFLFCFIFNIESIWASKNFHPPILRQTLPLQFISRNISSRHRTTFYIFDKLILSPFQGNMSKFFSTISHIIKFQDYLPSHSPSYREIVLSMFYPIKNDIIGSFPLQDDQVSPLPLCQNKDGCKFLLNLLIERRSLIPLSEYGLTLVMIYLANTMWQSDWNF